MGVGLYPHELGLRRLVWPGSLVVTGALLAPLSQSGELTRWQRQTTSSAEEIAEKMISMTKPDCPPPLRQGERQS